MLNSIALQGRLTKDPELKTTNKGVNYVNFMIACDRNYVPNNGERKADFIPVVAWRGTADFICKYFHKGDMILVNGELNSDSYEDKDGNRRTTYKVKADRVNFAGSKRKGTSENNYDTKEKDAFNGKGRYDAEEDDLPF